MSSFLHALQFILIVDDVPANNTIWIIGDSLLTNAAGHYNQFKRKKDQKYQAGPDSQPLYIESMYAIRLIPSGIYTAEQAKNMPNIILNLLVDTLNVKAKVPHSIVIMINDHRFWNNADLLSYQMDRLIARFIKEFNRIIEARNLSLPPKAANWDFPRLFITRALPLPNNMTRPYPKGFKANRRRFNRLIQRGEEQHKYRSINLSEFTCDNSNKFFAPDGTITHTGYQALWIGVSDAIHKADNQDRIILNKAKAKQLAMQIAVTTDEVAQVKGNGCYSDLSDIEPLGNHDATQNQRQKTPKSTKRALINDFNDQHIKRKMITGTMSPSSAISEYYTTQGKSGATDNPGFHHKRKFAHEFNRGYHHKKKARNKTAWFHNNWK